MRMVIVCISVLGEYVRLYYVRQRWEYNNVEEKYTMCTQHTNAKTADNGTIHILRI